MLLMRHDNRPTFGRALEDLDGRKRHAAGTIVEALRNLSVRPDLAVLDRDAEFLMSRLPPIERALIDAERVGHFPGRSHRGALASEQVSRVQADRSSDAPSGWLPQFAGLRSCLAAYRQAPGCAP